MILNTGGRTDTVQYYSEWLLNRFREGYVLSRNPLFPNIVNRIELNPETIDVVVFCSKDYGPILPRLHEISDRFNCYYHYTITAYGTDIEPRVPSIEESIRTLKALAAQVGPEKIAWRYDPVLLTCATKEDYEQFGIHRSGCMTAEVFSMSLGIRFKKSNHKGSRAGCLCMESRGLGDYNSCPNGCRYCYANKDHEKALQNYFTHDPKSPLLLGHLHPDDKIVPSRQESLLSKEPRLFD